MSPRYSPLVGSSRGEEGKGDEVPLWATAEGLCSDHAFAGTERPVGCGGKGAARGVPVLRGDNGRRHRTLPGRGEKARLQRLRALSPRVAAPPIPEPSLISYSSCTPFLPPFPFHPHSGCPSPPSISLSLAVQLGSPSLSSSLSSPLPAPQKGMQHSSAPHHQNALMPLRP